jgi:hypothetical protein
MVIQYLEYVELIFYCTGTSSQIVMKVIHASVFASNYIPEINNNGLGIDNKNLCIEINNCGLGIAYKNLCIFALFHTLHSSYRKCENTYIVYGVKHRCTIVFKGKIQKSFEESVVDLNLTESGTFMVKQGS